MQKTIKKDIFIEGIGVHSGTRSSILLRPSKEDSGIVIKNKFFPDHPFPVGQGLPEPAMHATVICDPQKKWFLSTVEHLLCAIIGIGIDNIEIEVDGIEIPILDGSSLPFVQAIKKVGFLEQDAKKRFLTPKKKISFQEKNKFIEITPATEDVSVSFDYSVEFEHPLVQASKLECTLSSDFFEKEIAPARTFGFLHQLPFLRKHGLAKGTTLGNTVVVGEETFMNSRRFDDEFIRHKLLDLIGDLALLGKPIAGKIKAHRTGHNLNRLVVKHFLENRNDWKIL